MMIWMVAMTRSSLRNRVNQYQICQNQKLKKVGNRPILTVEVVLVKSKKKNKKKLMMRVMAEK